MWRAELSDLEWRETMKCECSDPGCPCCGDCQDDADCVLYRIDMEDETGTPMCDRCADDAYESGLYADGE